MGLIYASSPEAKGKSEQRFDDFQRRPFLCEKSRVPDLADANRLLQELVAFDNEQRVHPETGEIPQQRGEAALRHGKSSLRPLEPQQALEVILAPQEKRLVKKDGTIRFLSRFGNVGRFRALTPSCSSRKGRSNSGNTTWSRLSGDDCSGTVRPFQLEGKHRLLYHHLPLPVKGLGFTFTPFYTAFEAADKVFLSPYSRMSISEF